MQPVIVDTHIVSELGTPAPLYADGLPGFKVASTENIHGLELAILIPELPEGPSVRLPVLPPISRRPADRVTGIASCRRQRLVGLTLVGHTTASFNAGGNSPVLE